MDSKDEQKGEENKDEGKKTTESEHSYSLFGVAAHWMERAAGALRAQDEKYAAEEGEKKQQDPRKLMESMRESMRESMKSKDTSKTEARPAPKTEKEPLSNDELEEVKKSLGMKSDKEDRPTGGPTSGSP